MTWTKTAGIASMVGLTMAAIVHVATFSRSAELTQDLLLAPVFLLAIVLCPAAILSLLYLADKESPADRRDSFIDELRVEGAARKAFSSRVISVIPLTMRASGVLLLIYAAVTFFMMVDRLEGGNPIEEDGRFYLNVHGHRVRELTTSEYKYFNACQWRLLSAHLGLWLFAATVVFLVVHPRIRATSIRGEHDDSAATSATRTPPPC